MSMKRQATSDINRDNWDQDDPADHEEMGMFKTASSEDLQKRVIRTAKRRFQPSVEAKKSVFSGFGGFNKTQPSSFDFLANLTNGNKTTQASTTTSATEATTASSLFNSKPLTFQSSIVSSSTTLTNTTFGVNSQPTTPFGGSPSSTAQLTTLFSASKPVTSVKDSPFNTSAGSTSNEPSFSFKVTAASTVANTSSPVFGIKVTAPSTIAQTSSPMFGIKVTAASTVPQTSSSVFGTASVTSTKSLFTTSSSKSAINLQSVANNTQESNMFKMSSNTENEKNKATVNIEKDESDNRRKMKYYANIKTLNESVLAWIKQNVEESPVCILTPIFKDYEKYLADIQERYHKKNVSKPELAKAAVKESFQLVTTPVATEISKPVCETPSKSEKEAPKVNEKTSPSLLSSKPPANTSSPNFSFGIKNTTTTSSFTPNTVTSTSTSPFSSNTTSTPFSNTNTTTSPAAAPFSFGIGKPFSFSPNTLKPANTDNEKKENEEETDEPPKVEFTPVVEENSVYDKRCKIFVKKDDTFADKGVGTLYIKKLESGKHQLLVRANTNLGTVLLNIILASGVPTQRMGKNNVMLVCMPTPDAKPPPVPVLIRVKTSEEADALLETLNKHKA